MPPFTLSFQSRRGLSDRLLIIGFCVLTLMIVLLTASALITRNVWNQRAEAQLAKFRDAGIATSLEDLGRRINARQPEPNAAELYRAAFAKERTANGRDHEWLPVIGRAKKPDDGEPMPPEMVAAIAEFLEENREALDLYRQAAEVEECAFGFVLDARDYPRFDHLGGLRNGARLLWLKALYEADQGLYDESAATRRVALRLGRHLGTDEMLIGVLTRFAIVGIGSADWGPLLAAEVSDGALEEVQRELAALYDEYLMAKAIEMEVAFGHSIYRSLRNEISNDWAELEPWLFLAYATLGQVERDRLNYLTLIDEKIEFARSPLASRVAWLEARAGAASAEESAWRAFIGGRWFAGQALGFGDRLLDTEVRSLGSLRVTSAAIAVARYRMAKGYYPETLDLVAPGFASAEFLLVPGKTDLLKYELTSETFTIGDGRYATITVRRR